MIYHLVPTSDWQQALKSGDYAPDSLTNEGFIHCSVEEQLLDSAKLYYQAEQKLTILHMEPDQLGEDLRWEDSASRGASFPHIYRSLKPSEIREVSFMERDANGDWDWIR